MTIILEDTKQVEFHTDLSKIVMPFRLEFGQLNWLLTDLDFILLDANEFGDAGQLDNSSSAIAYSGQELGKFLDERRIQFVWGVFSGFRGDIPEIPDDMLPFVDMNQTFWKKPDDFQIESAEIEIICWDSSSTIIKFKDTALAENFMKAFPDAKVINAPTNSPQSPG